MLNVDMLSKLTDFTKLTLNASFSEPYTLFEIKFYFKVQLIFKKIVL